MTTLATLTIDLLAESAQFRSELKKANKATDDWSKKTRESANMAAKAIAGFGVTAALGISALYTSTASSIDQQTKFADKIGISTEALAGLQYAGELTGVSSEKLNMGLQRMTRRVAEAAGGTGEAVKALDELGLSAQQLNAMSPDQQFSAIAGAMDDIGQRSDQVRLAFKLFDAEGVGLLNTLDLGVDGLSAMQAEAESLGIAMNRIDAAKIEQANDAFYKTSLTSKGFAQHLTAELAPIVQGISEEFIRASNAAGGMGEVATDAINAMVNAVGVMGDSFHGIKIIWTGVKALMYQVAVDAIETVRLVEQEVKGVINTWRNFFGQELLAMNRSLTESSINLRMGLNDAKKELINLASAELPSDKVERYVHQWRELAQAQAEVKANSLIPDITPPAANAPEFSEKDLNELDRIRQNHMTKEQLLLEQTLKEQEILINAEMAKQLSEQESQALREASWNSYYERVGKAADDSNQQQAQAQLRANQQMAQMQAQVAQQAIGLVKTTAEEGSAVWMAALVAEKGIAIAQAIINSEVAATRALAELGPIAGPPMAATMRTMGYASAGLIAATGVAEIAGAREKGGEVRYGQTYLVGERGPELFTAGATGQITSNDNLQKAMGGQAANQPIQQITFAPQIVVESGTGQDADAAFAEEVADRAYVKVYEDIVVGGDISKALGRS